jgi:hypothetical protein
MADDNEMVGLVTFTIPPASSGERAEEKEKRQRRLATRGRDWR